MKGNDSKEGYYLALLNAAAMIEGHGEEGGIYQEDYDIPVKIYIREAKSVAKMLYRKAANYKKKYKLP